MGNIAMAGLLVVMGVGVFVLPAFSAPSPDITLPGKIALLVLLVAGIAAIREFRRTALLLAVLVAALLFAWVVEISRVWHISLLMSALVVLAVAISVSVFAAHRRVSDRICGAIALYLLLALVWAGAYAIVAAIVPGAFAGALPAHPTLFDWTYFSLVSLTTVGYGDITPVAHPARSLAALEAFIGQLYPAIIIARLVSAPATPARS